MAVVEVLDLTSSKGRSHSASRSVNGVDLQLAAFPPQTVSDLTLSVRTSKTLRFLAGLAERAESWRARRTGGRASAPLPKRTSVSAEASESADHAERTNAKRWGARRMRTKIATGGVYYGLPLELR